MLKEDYEARAAVQEPLDSQTSGLLFSTTRVIDAANDHNKYKDGRNGSTWRAAYSIARL